MKLKRLLASLLVLCLTLTLLPSRVQAAETAETNVDNSSMTVEGTNGFGNLLSTEIAESQSEEAASGCQAGYSVTELTFDGSTATVTYAALEEAILVVAVYTEDGLQMLASGKTTVSPDTTQATVVIEGDVPEYFYAGAFLMDLEDYVPLCENYSTPMYTREMQELLTSTTDDYDPSLVYNLDDDKTKNFAVFAEDTVVVREQAGVNTITAADDTNRVYVIENADEAITSLQQGDVLAYPYGEGQILIVKVDTITLDGTTATITGTDLEMEEVFSHVKMDGTTSTFEVDTSTADDCFTYIDPGANTRSAEPSISTSVGSTVEIMIDEFEHNGIPIKIEGSLEYKITASASYYVTPSYKRLDFKLDFEQNFVLTVTGKIKPEKGFSLGEMKLYPLPAISVVMAPEINFEFSGALKIQIKTLSSLGFYIEYLGKKWTPHLLWVEPVTDFDPKLEGEFFIGLTLTPSLEILEGVLADAEVEGKIGVVVSAKQDLLSDGTDAPCVHSCIGCIDGDVSFTYSITPSITLLNNDNLQLKEEWLSSEVKFLDFYWSVDNGSVGLGTCPWIRYKTTIVVLDGESNPAKGKAVFLWDTENTKITNEHGIVEFYLNNGSHDVMVYFDSATVTMQIIVKDDSQKVIISEAIHTKKPSGIEGDIDSEAVMDSSSEDALSVGDYIELGTYLGKPILWRCVSIDENGPLMLSDKVLCFKAYDASGDDKDYHEDGWGYIRRERGSNCWSDSSIREWLNSEDATVNYSHCPPTREHVTENPYDAEAGFLNGFTEQDLDALKVVTQLMIINEWETTRDGYCDGGSSELPEYSINQLSGITDYSVYYHQYVTDRMFFLNAKQIAEVNQNVPGYLENSYATNEAILQAGLDMMEATKHPYAFWTSIPSSNGASYELIRTGPLLHYHEWGCNGSVGVRPAFYLNTDAEYTVIKDSADDESGTNNDHTYVLYESAMTWKEAEAFCESKGGYLATITSEEENNMVIQLLEEQGSKNCYWIGMNRDNADGNWMWVTGEDVVYTNWTAGEPNDFSGYGENFVHLFGVFYTDDAGLVKYVGQWNDATNNSETTPGSFYDLNNYGFICEFENPSTADSISSLLIPEQPTDEMTPDAVYGGEYATEITDTYTLKTATFSGLVPGAEYVMLAMVSIETEDILAADNLLGILQATAGTDGTLVFQYVQRVDTDVSYVVACGASNKDLADAEITFPEMTADGTLQVVNPTVTYGGKSLTEGVDYEIIGTVDFTDPGEYTCQIRGIHNYTGLVTCTYTVTKNPVLFGDLTGDGEVDIFDANLIVAFYNGTADLNADALAAADVNGDGDVDIFDANLVVSYYNGTIAAFPVEE